MAHMATPSSTAMVLNSRGTPPGLADGCHNERRRFAQMDVTRHKFGKGIDDGDDRLCEVLGHHAGGPPQCPCRHHTVA